MNNTLAIAQREITDRRFVFVAAGAFLLLALVVPFVPGVRSGERTAALVVGSLALALNFTLGLAAILGSSIVGRELSDGRLSFYFSKPVAATSIWWGKLTAALVLIVACFTIVALPAFVVGSTTAVRRWVNTPEEMLTTASMVIGGAIALFLVAHVLGTFVRSRSVWFLFDFVAASVCGVAVWMMGRILLLGFAIELAKALAIVVAVLVAIAVIAAGAWQIARGRTDRRRSHMELSRFLWAAIGVGLLVISGYVMWVVAVPVSQLTNPEFLQASSGSWSMITGEARNRGDYRASFLYNLNDRRSLRLTGVNPWNFQFSRHGTTSAWMTRTGLSFVRLDVPKPEPTLTRVTGGSIIALSDDGSRAAVSGDDVVAVYDLRSQASLGSIRVAQWRHAQFISRDVLRVYSGASIVEYDVRTKTLRNIDPSNARRLAGTWPLRDGRLLAVENRETASVLRLLKSDGSPIREIVLPEPRVRWTRVTESLNGIVSVVLTQHTVVVDINRGVILRQEPRMLCQAGSVGPNELCLWQQRLVIWNPATGEKRPVS